MTGERFINDLAEKMPQLKNEGDVKISVAELRRCLVRSFEAGQREARTDALLDDLAARLQTG